MLADWLDWLFLTPNPRRSPPHTLILRGLQDSGSCLFWQSLVLQTTLALALMLQRWLDLCSMAALRSLGCLGILLVGTQTWAGRWSAGPPFASEGSLSEAVDMQTKVSSMRAIQEQRKAPGNLYCLTLR